MTEPYFPLLEDRQDRHDEPAGRRGEPHGRHAHRSPGGRRRRRGRSALALLFVLALLAGLGGGGYYGYRVISARFAVADYPGNGTGRAVVDIKPGDTATDIGRTLQAAGVVESFKAFVQAADKDPRSRNLQPGSYQLRKQMRASAALALLLNPASRLLARVSLAEGLTVQQAFSKISSVTGISLADLQAAAKNPTALELPAWANGNLEGFLFPATYDFQPGSTATQVLRTMVRRFVTEAASMDLVNKAQAMSMSPYQIVTIASVVEKEGRVASDYPKIARVIYNRLQAGMPLQVDATVLYGVGKAGTGQPPTQQDLASASPYNSYKVKGLPPTPIAAPGHTALAAALAPAPGNWLYYVLMDKQGRHFFTNDYNAFLAQKAKSQQEGLF